MKKLLLPVMGVAMLGMSGTAVAEDCGDIKVASMDWASAEFVAEVDKFILEEGYGCNVENVAGATVPTFTSMNEKGVPDMAGELWANAFVDALNVAYDEGRLVKANPKPFASVGEGWWITPATQKRHPELKTVLDVIDHPELFPHPEDPSKGGFYTCPAGWGCQLVNANLFRAFDMEAKGWKLVNPGSAGALDASIAKASDRDENWFGYYWTPTAIIGKYNMVMVPYGVDFAGSENWDGCIVKPEQECADPKPSAWTVSEVNSVVTDELQKRAPEVVKYVAARTYPAPVINGMLSYMVDNQATGEDAAIEFLSNYEDVWSAWVSADVAEKIKSAL